MMSFVVSLFWAALLFASYALSFTPCPLLGPAYPPFILSQNSTILSTALENLTAQFDQLMATGYDSHGSVTPNTTSFSIALFSTNTGTAASNPFFYEYHYTAPFLENSTIGVTYVDADSIYRIGSLTEIFTIWSVLIEAGDQIWNDPVTKYVPELEEAAAINNSSNEVTAVVDWRSVTVGQLASHMSGISRDFGYAGISKDIQDPIAYGFPELPQDTSIACSSYSECNRTEFFASVTKEPPVVLPGTSPAYSSNSFQVLGYVVENITGKPFQDTLKNRILDPLGMNQTSLSTPSNHTTGVIPDNEIASGWTTYYGDAAPALSMYTSVRDLSIAGKAILSSSLLSNAQTNRWLKPVTHTSNPANSVGLPWTVYSGGNYPNTSMVDIYTALSNFGLYSSYLGLVPDYNVGFSILAADTTSNADLNAHADIIGDVLLPAMTEVAISNAASKFAGTYVLSSSSSGGIPLNSSMTISFDSMPGIFIDSFISNGSDFRKALAILYDVADPKALSMRLYPTTRTQTSSGSGSVQAFRAVYQDENALADNGTPTCVSWMEVDKVKYGSFALDWFIFELNEDEEATSVEIPALRVKLGRMN